MRRELLVPASIVLGSSIIATGLFLGLRGGAHSRPVDTSSSPLAPTTPGAATSAEPPLPHVLRPVIRAPVDDAELRRRVAADALAALEAQRPAIRASCWAPAVAREPQPPRGSYVFNVSFDARGLEIARGITEVRGASRGDVARCLRERPMDLRVAPPGVNVGVEVPFDLP